MYTRINLSRCVITQPPYHHHHTTRTKSLPSIMQAMTTIITCWAMNNAQRRPPTPHPPHASTADKQCTLYLRAPAPMMPNIIDSLHHACARAQTEIARCSSQVHIPPCASCALFGARYSCVYCCYQSSWAAHASQAGAGEFCVHLRVDSGG